MLHSVENTTAPAASSSSWWKRMANTVVMVTQGQASRISTTIGTIPETPSSANTASAAAGTTSSRRPSVRKRFLFCSSFFRSLDAMVQI